MGALIVAICACFSAHEVEKGALDWALEDGGRLADLVSPADTTVLLLYNPMDCMSCSSDLARWRRWEQAGRGSLELVLTRAPSESERAQLRLFRVAPAGVLRDVPPGGTPRVYRYHGTVLVDSAVGAAQQRLLARSGF